MALAPDVLLEQGQGAADPIYCRPPRPAGNALQGEAMGARELAFAEGPPSDGDEGSQSETVFDVVLRDAGVALAPDVLLQESHRRPEELVSDIPRPRGHGLKDLPPLCRKIASAEFVSPIVDPLTKGKAAFDLVPRDPRVTLMRHEAAQGGEAGPPSIARRIPRPAGQGVEGSDPLVRQPTLPAIVPSRGHPLAQAIARFSVLGGHTRMTLTLGVLPEELQKARARGRPGRPWARRLSDGLTLEGRLVISMAGTADRRIPAPARQSLQSADQLGGEAALLVVATSVVDPIAEAEAILDVSPRCSRMAFARDETTQHGQGLIEVRAPDRPVAP